MQVQPQIQFGAGGGGWPWTLLQPVLSGRKSSEIKAPAGPGHLWSCIGPTLALACFWWLVGIFGVPGFAATSPHFAFIIVPCSLGMTPSSQGCLLITTGCLGLELCPTPHLNPSSYLIPYVKPFFQIRSHSHVLGVRTSTCLFFCGGGGVTQFNP